MAAQKARGLTAAELALAVVELRATCALAAVLDAAALIGTDDQHDLLLVLRRDDDAPKTFVHVALGGARARVTTTARRFGRERRARGPGADLLQRELQDAVLRDVEHVAGERRCALLFDAPGGARRLVVELFSARGLWALCDGDGVVLTMSRSIETAVRALRRGDVYRAPPPTPSQGEARGDDAPRFADLAAIDAHFTAQDLQREQQHDVDGLRLAAERARKKAQHKVDGMQRQLADGGRSQHMRQTADLMLAYAHGVPRGATSMEVPSFDGDDVQTIELDPKLPVAAQANRLYDKARRLDDGRAITERRLDDARAQLGELDALCAQLEQPDDERLAQARARLEQLGAVPKPKPLKPGRSRQQQAVPFRRFASHEGYPIFVGRNNHQNDELTMRFANGNDLWLHVGGGRPGSHVVVRLPKNKTASLETLLDAAALAVHYSKARGEPRIDVVYTLRKNVRKPKGLPAGAVVPAQTKTVTVLHDERRLRRVLATSAGDDD